MIMSSLQKRHFIMHGELGRQKKRGSKFTKSWTRRFFTVEKVDTLSRYGSTTSYRLCYYNVKKSFSELSELLACTPRFWAPLDEVVSVSSRDQDKDHRCFSIHHYTQNFTLRADSLGERNYWIVGLLTLCGLEPTENDRNLQWPSDRGPCPDQVVHGGTISEVLARERRISQERLDLDSGSSDEGGQMRIL